MINLIKKDFLTISRDRAEVLILLAMPMIIIVILGFALGGIVSGKQEIKKIPIALVLENNFEKDINYFEEALKQKGLSEEEIKSIILRSLEADPAVMFMKLLESPEIKKSFDIKTEYNFMQAEEAVMNEKVSGVITLPNRFSYDTLMSIYLEKEPKAVVGILIPDKEQFRGIIIENIVTGFTEEYNLELAILQATGGVPVESEVLENFGKITYLPTQRPVPAFQYYTMGMAMMFSLYVASTVSSNAFKEKSTYAFARLMLTGEKPLRYLISKGISATVLSITQLFILFALSSLIFKTFRDMSLASLIDMAIVTLICSLTIGSLAALLTAVALQFNSDGVSGVFSGFLVSGFAFIGGSMMPVEQFSPVLREIGNWTPNGAMMTIYLQLIQGFGLKDAMPMIFRVVAMMVIFIIVALAIFPKRRLA